MKGRGRNGAWAAIVAAAIALAAVLLAVPHASASLAIPLKNVGPWAEYYWNSTNNSATIIHQKILTYVGATFVLVTTWNHLVLTVSDDLQDSFKNLNPITTCSNICQSAFLVNSSVGGFANLTINGNGGDALSLVVLVSNLPLVLLNATPVMPSDPNVNTNAPSVTFSSLDAAAPWTVVFGHKYGASVLCSSGLNIGYHTGTPTAFGCLLNATASLTTTTDGSPNSDQYEVLQFGPVVSNGGIILTNDPPETAYVLIGVALLVVAVAVVYLFAKRRRRDDGW